MRDSSAHMKAPNEEIYGKSTKEHNAEKYIQWVTTIGGATRKFLGGPNLWPTTDVLQAIYGL